MIKRFGQFAKIVSFTDGLRRRSGLPRMGWLVVQSGYWGLPTRRLLPVLLPGILLLDNVSRKQRFR